jgi:hypothetical protein
MAKRIATLTARMERKGRSFTVILCTGKKCAGEDREQGAGSREQGAGRQGAGSREQGAGSREEKFPKD